MISIKTSWIKVWNVVPRKYNVICTYSSCGGRSNGSEGFRLPSEASTLCKVLKPNSKFCLQGKMKPSFAEKTLKDGMKRIKTTTDINALKECDVVVESIVENVEIKKKVFGQLSNILSPGAIVGSNTSSLSISELVCLSQYFDVLISDLSREASTTTLLLFVVSTSSTLCWLCSSLRSSAQRTLLIAHTMQRSASQRYTILLHS